MNRLLTIFCAALVLTAATPSVESDTILRLDDCDLNLVSNVSFEVTPEGDTLLTATTDGQGLDCLVPIVNPPVITTFNVTPTLIDPGETVTFNWTIAGTSPTCSATGGTAAWQGTTITIPTGQNQLTLQGGGTFSITCTNSAGSDTETRTVTQNNTGFPPPPAFCNDAGRQPPDSVERQTTFSYFPPLSGTTISAQSFEDVFGPFPGSSSANLTRDVIVPQNRYIAMPFRTSTSTGTILDLSWFGNARVANNSTITISQCPGDFNVATLPNRCFAESGTEGGSLLGIVGSSVTACDMNADTVYYLNVISAESATPTVNQCNRSGGCTFQVST